MFRALPLAILLLALPLRAERLSVGGAAIDLEVHGEPALGRAAIVDWVRASAGSVSAYFGHFPIPALRVSVRVDGRAAPHGGVTRAWPTPRIDIAVGRSVSAQDLARDWVMVHEMCHTGFPNVDRDHHAWAEEGLSTYLEPLARRRAGRYTREKIWLDLVQGLPKGLPEAGDRGLDHTPTWGRTYWGGALFWLLADIQIRQKTGGKQGLEHALRGILRAGGDVRADWPLERALATGDRATGVAVLVPLHQRPGTRPEPVDLAGLWKQLGVQVTGRRVTFDDAAPLAGVRRAIEES